MKDFLVACVLTLLGLAAGLLLSASDAHAELADARAGGPARAVTAPSAGGLEVGGPGLPTVSSV